MPYSLLILLAVSSDVYAYNYPYDARCHETTKEWRTAFEGVFSSECPSEPLTYSEWPKKLIKAFLNRYPKIKREKVRIFDVTNFKIKNMKDLAAKMFNHLIEKNNWRKSEACQMFKDKSTFACMPHCEYKYRWGKYVPNAYAYCAFTSTKEEEWQIPGNYLVNRY